jgi:D-3-phosphoglycerate dehydrogenase
MLIYVTEPKEIDPEALSLLREHGFAVLEDKDAAAARAGEVVGLFIRTYTTADKALLSTFPNLKYVLRAGVGLDNVDVDECKSRGIAVINSPGANANAVAEYVVGSALFMLRKMAMQQHELTSGGWRKEEFVGSELKGKVLGLVGCGNVGKMIAHKLSNFGLQEIIGYDPFLSAEQLKAAGIRKVELPEAISQSDILSLHVPLLPETKHLVNKDSLASMKKGALLINAARGGVVDEVALAKALQGHLSGAVLDVFEGEPKVEPSLLGLSNILLTPHIGGYTHEANKEVSLAPVRELVRLVAGSSVV